MSVSIPPHISEVELRSVLEKRARLKKLAAEVKELGKTLEIEEGAIIQKLKSKFPVIGKLIAKLGSQTGKKTVSWKDEWSDLISKAGKDVAVEEAKLKAKVDAPVTTTLDITDPEA